MSFILMAQSQQEAVNNINTIFRQYDDKDFSCNDPWQFTYSNGFLIATKKCVDRGLVDYWYVWKVSLSASELSPDFIRTYQANACNKIHCRITLECKYGNCIYMAREDYFKGKLVQTIPSELAFWDFGINNETRICENLIQSFRTLTK